ncbi:TPA: subtype I-F CRISPR-associated endonuclease Cas1, partial [Legionella pneumophila]|nr:subtype I-F CRISPR-associated endonuclease Cas1 [Legionella pneumophila]HAU0298459.1 subtype I-F CRISPR-associated endonuclease Cas1 [Legionella pneumophila]HAU0866213.1 subtype I-F CRISPR-associated endonuclease Cas1 [Legionella pneumophila]HAU0950406.1 subtype I-F CRISPR-associated endonuclease Cas1 [Legionella pneumophila]HAU1712321.1 subtype I-F CRISPR-associated endonuclease Cas1 [Legionella pneumophila]
CLQAFIDHKALDYMFEQVKAMALNTDWESENSEENLL